jgi:hypothetical protein
MSNKLFDFASHKAKQQDFTYYEQHFFLRPKQITKFTPTVGLVWHRIPFQKKSFSTVAKLPGVYAFTVGHHARGLPPHAYVLYIGQTGAKRKDRTLRQRVKEYYLEKTTGKRPLVAEFLNKWETCLFFYYAPLDPNSTNLLELERRLNDALMPPYSLMDFSPEIRKRKRLLEAK